MKLNYKNKKIVFIAIFLPLLFLVQYYVFKVGVIPPAIKGINIKIIEGDYIQDIDKYTIRLGDSVVLSPSDYIKIPQYAKDPNVKFRILDNSKTIKLKENDNNTVEMSAIKTGYTSIAVMQNSRVIQKATIKVVDPSVEKLDVCVDGDLEYVGDSASISSLVQVDYEEFSDNYSATYESSNSDVLKVEDNKIKAVGVGKATIYITSKDKIEAIRYNIVAKLTSINIENDFDLAVGETIKLDPAIITKPKNLKTPNITYRFSQSKMPIERSIILEEDGTIVGIRPGSEKITISCGDDENKKIEVVNINIKQGKIENSMIENVFCEYIIKNNKLQISMKWDILDSATNYDIYIRDNISTNNEFSLYKSITQENYEKDLSTDIKIDLGKQIEEISYEIYVIGRNEEGNSKPSNIQVINSIIKGDTSAKKERENK